MKDRIYVCHTFYHVYIACLKEFYAADGKGASLVLSKMSNRFGTLKERAERSGIFEAVYEYDEKPAQFFPELAPLKEDAGNIVLNMFKRIRFCKALAKRQEKYVPVDFREYGAVYVFCDSDPIGYYLDWKKIPYHALEDGLDCIKNYDTARYDNRGHFGIKAFMSSLGLIHIQNGYAKYCIDMEVNDISVLQYPCKKYVELPRKKLTEHLTAAEKELLLALFVEDLPALKSVLGKGNEDAPPTLLVLTGPLCDADTRKRIFRDIVDRYDVIDGRKASVIIKQHPRDLVDYHEVLPEALILDAGFPMEMFNFLEDICFDRLVGVYTEMEAIAFAKEKIRLGHDFMDVYEDPEKHRFNEAI
ncbi:MAG: lipooligosaccharide sialyltransferase [Lachnospiraceae bacterium]|nr:lipooligosaccharide sialyltransferase [Lachnospiraceae bacterium]